MNRSNFFSALLLLTALPPGAQAPQPRYLPNADTVCEAALPDGTSYEAWDRVFLTSWMGQPLYVKVRAYYRPGSGEFLWRSTGLPKTGYAHALKENSGKARTSCEEPRSHILLLQDGEWADFWAHGGRITVFHSNLKLHTREKVWSYIAQHWQEGSDDPHPSAKCALNILLYDQLGSEFFRPKSLEFDARPYTYDPLISAKKVGSNWEVGIKGADEPNRAIVLLDREFKVIKVTKNTSGGR